MATITPYVKPGHRLLRVLDNGVTHPCGWPDGCDKQAVHVLLDNGVDPDPAVDGVHGTQGGQFDTWVHADGTCGHGQFDAVYHQERCPRCQAYSTMDHRDTGYGDLRTCLSCGYSDYHDRGD